MMVLVPPLTLVDGDGWLYNLYATAAIHRFILFEILGEYQIIIVG